MQKAKLFLENFFIYGFVSVLNKVIPLLLLPVIARLLSDPSDFGVFDLYSTIYGFGMPLAMLGLYDAMFREHFEKEDQEYRYNVTTTALQIILVTSTVVGSLLLLFNLSFSQLFFGDGEHRNIVVYAALALFLGNNITIVSAPTRIQNHRKTFVYSGFLNSLAYYLLAIGFIYLGHTYLGLIYAHLLSSVVLFLYFWIHNRKFFMLGKFDKGIAKELLKIGIPLVPTFLIYWIYNSMDRIMIINMMGTTELGIYSIGARLASVSSLIYAAFAGGWQYFSFSTMKEENQVGTNSNIFDYLSALSFLSLIVIYPFISLLFNVLFPPEYAGGIKVVPYLYLAPLLLMLFQVVENQFIIIKKSYWSTITLSVGAFTNVLLNWLFIPIMGIEGAALATLLGYGLTIVSVILLGRKLKLHVISKRFLHSAVIIALYLGIVRSYFYENLLAQVLLSILCSSIYIYWYKEELSLVYSKVRTQLVKKKLIE